MPTSQILDWPDCINVRDLGGLATAGGGRIAAGALIRSDNLTRLTEAGIKIVREAGIGRILDLRSAAECEHDPSPFAGEALHCNRILARPDDPWDPALRLGENYVINLDLNPDLYAAAVEAVATAPAGAVVVHCHSGKDRSGTVVALALSLAGVSAEAIAADYAAVSEQTRALFNEWLAAATDPTEREQLAEELSSRPETMIAMLDHLDSGYGGTEAYLRRGGLGSEAVDRLRSRLIESAG
ncbi:tyrosine-protein phosphatase [Microlunatus speluncae]|uniref:tyrosine-protein phosphatase n=1 Tax=Microlunatus speluncae TaxID=2594267 RepID=UPI001266280C|nr:tyrosine-protein phosphatase [Microlunatus speluncae]